MADLRQRDGRRPFAAADILVLGLLLAVCFAAAGIGSIATIPNVDTWYEALEKPAWTPPDATFSIVWPILYAVMAVAAWLVWRQGTEKPAVHAALVAFFVQLAVNVSWSWAFFAAQNPPFGLAVILVLLCALVWTIRRFGVVNRLSAWLMAPYLLWVAFAAMLNAAIVVMNR